ncbi:MAG: structural cement protein Gp24 [Nannocystaceae bacterium]
MVDFSMYYPATKIGDRVASPPADADQPGILSTTTPEDIFPGYAVARQAGSLPFYKPFIELVSDGVTPLGIMPREYTQHGASAALLGVTDGAAQGGVALEIYTRGLVRVDIADDVAEGDDVYVYISGANQGRFTNVNEPTTNQWPGSPTFLSTATAVSGDGAIVEIG